MTTETANFCEFTLVIYTSDGNEYNERGQTLASVLSTVQDYIEKYDVTEAAMGDDECGWITVYVDPRA